MLVRGAPALSGFRLRKLLSRLRAVVGGIEAEFEGVKRSYLPLHSVLRIDEVKKQGVSKISTYEGSNVAQFPMPVFPPPAGDGSKK